MSSHIGRKRPSTKHLEITDIESALGVLRDSLMSDSPETARKAAMDIIQLASERPDSDELVTEEQLEFIGRVLGEVKEISPDLGELESGTSRSLTLLGKE